MVLETVLWLKRWGIFMGAASTWEVVLLLLQQEGLCPRASLCEAFSPSVLVLSAMCSLRVRYSYNYIIFLLANICLMYLSLCSSFQLPCVPLLYCVA